ncbi:MAG: hypothetical protein HYX61_03270 [Gammaproteobacteria bacterium]|jgi:hypothetical protein|nr:hypothetical protein [Gammaproteobacteria bacterium]
MTDYKKQQEENQKKFDAQKHQHKTTAPAQNPHEKTQHTTDKNKTGKPKQN